MTTNDIQGGIPTEQKTCFNCKHYHSTLSGRDHFHIHDYCDVWMTTIPSSVIFDRFENACGYDDLERGIAGCWAFESREALFENK